MPLVTRQDGSQAYLPTEEAAIGYATDVWPGDPNPESHVTPDDVSPDNTEPTTDPNAQSAPEPPQGEGNANNPQ